MPNMVPDASPSAAVRENTERRSADAPAAERATEISTTPTRLMAMAKSVPVLTRSPEKDQSEQRRLRRFGTRIGRADREIAMAEDLDQQGLGGNLRQSPQA